MAKQVTRQMMIEEVAKRLPDSRPEGNSFAMRGAQMQFDRGLKLIRRLKSGGNPSVQEVVGYFGKGARFSE